MKAPPDATPCRSATSWRGWAPTRILTFGLPDDYFTTYTARVRSLSVSDVDNAAKEVVHPDQLVWVVVGGRSKVISERLFETVRHRQEKFLWWPYLFLLMPDHLHALLSFTASGKSLKLVVSKWKEWTAKVLGIVWQRDFFEHRLRHDESRREKADYILQNPV